MDCCMQRASRPIDQFNRDPAGEVIPSASTGRRRPSMLPNALQVTLVPLLLGLLCGCPGQTPTPSSPAGTRSQQGAPAEAIKEQLETAIPDDSFRLSIGETNDTETSIQRELLIDVPPSVKRIIVTWGNPGCRSSLPLDQSSEAERRCTVSVLGELLVTENGSDCLKVKGTWSLTIPNGGTTATFESELAENKGLLDVVALEAESGLYKQGKPVPLGSVNGQGLTLYVLRQIENTVPEAD